MEQILKKHNLPDGLKEYIVNNTPLSEEQNHQQFNDWEYMIPELYEAKVDRKIIERALKCQYKYRNYYIFETFGKMIQKGLSFKELSPLLDMLSDEKDTLIGLLPGVIAEASEQNGEEILKKIHKELIQFFTKENLERLITYRKSVKPGSKTVRGLIILKKIGIDLTTDFLIDQTIQGYELPAPFADYVRHNIAIPQQNMGQYVRNWESIIPILYEIGSDKMVLGRALEMQQNTESYYFNDTLEKLLSKKCPLKELIELLEMIPDGVMAHLPKLIAEFYQKKHQDHPVKHQFALDMVTFFTPEKIDQLFIYWENHDLSTYLIRCFTILQKEGVNIPQNDLMTLLQSHEPENNVFLPLAAMIEDQTALFDHFASVIPVYLSKYKATAATLKELKQWFAGDLPEKSVTKMLKRAAKETKSSYYRYQNFFLNKRPLQMDQPHYNKMITLGLAIDQYNVLNYLFALDPESDTVTKQYTITHEQWGYYVGNHYQYDQENSAPLLQKKLKNNFTATLKGILTASSDGITNILPYLIEFEPKKGIEVITTAATKVSTKGVKEKLFELAKEHPDGHTIAHQLITAQKQHPRQLATRLLIHFNQGKDLELLKKLYQEDTSALVTDLIGEYLETLTDCSGEAEEVDVQSIYDGQFKKFKAKKYRFLDQLPELRWLDDSKVDSKNLSFLLNTFEKSKSVIPPAQGRQFGTLLNRADLNKLAQAVYEQWDRQSKTKWMLGFVAAYGDDSLINPMKAEILKMVDHSRGAMAAQIVIAMAMIGSPIAFQTVDWFTRKVRHKQVKNAAIGALETAAAELDISKDELLDQIIPDFGLDQNSTLTLDYGPRQFMVKLASDLTLSITDNTGKTFKNLPKPNKNDDAEKGAAAKEQLKFLKKEMKAQIKNQQERLERNFSENRVWSGNKWLTLFPKHPLMKQFATGLIWGIYEDDKLKQALRYDESGAYYDVDDDEITLTGSEKLSLVHPMELSKADNDTWQEQLADNEIIQPFIQLKRPVFTPNDPDADKLSDFKGYCLSRISLKSKLFKKLWNRGSVQDAGCYYEYFKEFPNAGVGVELKFLGDCVGGYDDYSVIPIYDITFYKSGTVIRGSYVYDSPQKENILKLKDIPARLFSELYYEIKLIAESGEFKADWEKIDW